MSDYHLYNGMPPHLAGRLRRQMLTSGGRGEAFVFVWNHEGDPAPIRAKIEEKEEIMSDSRMLKGSMAPGASPRVYNESYVSGLKDALNDVLAWRGNGRATDGFRGRLAARVYREVLIAQARVAAAHTAWDCQGDQQYLGRRLHEAESAPAQQFEEQVQQMEIRDTMEVAADPDALRSSISSGESLEIYRQAYVEGLKEIISSIAALSIEPVR